MLTSAEFSQQQQTATASVAPNIQAEAQQRIASHITFSTVTVGDSTLECEFFLQNYQRHAHEKGSLYTWGSGEMGQLGYSSRIMSNMPKDRDGYPFQPYPLEIDQLRNKGIY